MDEIKRLIESRQVEATKKQLSKKMLCIAKYSGHKMYSEFGFGSGSMSTQYDSDDWLTEGEKGYANLPEATDDFFEYGYVFDALNSGHNLEIRYMSGDNELRTTYNGYVVYLEIDGKLRAYVPHNNWEEVVERLYQKAKVKEELVVKEEKIESESKFMREATKFLKELRDSWGF